MTQHFARQIARQSVDSSLLGRFIISFS